MECPLKHNLMVCLSKSIRNQELSVGQSTPIRHWEEETLLQTVSTDLGFRCALENSKDVLYRVTRSIQSIFTALAMFCSKLTTVDTESYLARKAV